MSKYSDCNGYISLIIPNVIANILFTISNIIYWILLKKEYLKCIMICIGVTLIALIAKICFIIFFFLNENKRFGNCYLDAK